MSTKIRRALITIKERVPLTRLLTYLFYQAIFVKWKKIKRHSTLIILITFAILFVSFIVYVSLLPNRFNAMSRIRYHYSECNRSSKLCDQEYFQYLAKKLFNTKYSGVDNYIQYTVAKLNLKPLTGVKSLRPEFGQVFNNVTAFQYPFEIKPCRYKNGTSNIFVAIISAVGNFKERENIRQTWLQTIHQSQSENISSIRLSGYGFITGETKDPIAQLQVEEESYKHGDIVQVNFIDNYYNLTLKVVGLINWLHKYCSRVDFVLKVDDDVFVNVRNLKAVISKTLNKSEKTIYGSSIFHRTERSGKWKINYEDWPWAKYPPYPNGGAVLFSGIAIEPLLAAAQVVPYLPFDDTYLLGLCTEKSGIKLHQSNRFFALEGKLGHCHVYNSITWLVPRNKTMDESYWVTEDFYKNLTQCTIVDSKGVNRTVNPNDYLLKMN